MTGLDRIEALHPKFPDSDHCQNCGDPFPCPTLVEVRALIVEMGRLRSERDTAAYAAGTAAMRLDGLARRVDDLETEVFRTAEGAPDAP